MLVKPEPNRWFAPLARFEQAPEPGDFIGLTQDHQNIVGRESDVSAGIGQYFGAPPNGQ